MKKCPKRPTVVTKTRGGSPYDFSDGGVRITSEESFTVSTVDDFGECIGSECAAWRRTKPMLRAPGMDGHCGLGCGDQFPDPAPKEKSDG